MSRRQIKVLIGSSVCLFYFLGISVLYAEVITLKSGRRIEGKILQKTDELIKVDYSGVEVTFYLDEIDNIDGKKIAGQGQSNTSAPDPSYRKDTGLTKGDFTLSNDTRLTKADFEEVTNFYYRSPKPDILFRVIKSLLSYDEFSSPSNNAFPAFAHFIAAVAVNTPALLKDLKEEEKLSQGAKKEALQRMIEAVAQYQPAEADSPEHITYLWQEFVATGIDAPLKKMLSVFERPQLSETDRVMRLMVESILKNTLEDHLKALSIVQTVEREAQGAYKEAIDDILAEVAQPYIQRGLNYKYQNNYQAALDEYNKALFFYPGSSAAYTNIAVIYELQGNMDKAFSTMQKAIELDPEDGVSAYNLGRLHFLKRQYDQAIIWYKKALSHYPKKGGYHHAIGRAYQEKGDTQNAIIHFKEYLTLTPHDEFVPLVKQYLASQKVVIPDDPEDVILMLEKKKYEQLETHLGNLLRSKKKDRNGYSLLYKAYEDLAGEENKYIIEQVLQNIRAWQEKYPSSHFANAVLGIFYINYAWFARGEGFVATVTEEGHRLFNERLGLAKQYLEKAYELNTADALVPAYLITVGKGLGVAREEIEKQFARAIKADATEFEAYSAKFDYLMPKWHGSVK